MSDNFADFDALLREAEREQEDVKLWNKKVHKRLDHAADPLEALLAECLTPKPSWIADANVVVIREMHCATCDSVEQRCDGWYTVQHHKSDKHARRLLAGKSPAPLPVRVERHQVPAQDVCYACAEAQVLIEESLHGKQK